MFETNVLSDGSALRQSGSVLIVVLVTMMMISALALSLSVVSTTDVELAGNYHASSKAFYAADGASRAAHDSIAALSRQLGRFPTAAELSSVAIPTIGGINYSQTMLTPTGAVTQGVLQNGFYQGLTAFSAPFDATITADTAGYPPASATVRVASDIDLIPIFQFATFYEYDLEISPGPSMVINGRVHTNADLYVASKTSLRFESVVTVAGDVFN